MNSDTPRTFQRLFDNARRSNTYWQESVILEFTEAVCKRLDDLKMSRAEFARKLGVSPAYITKILKGGQNYSLHSMFKICDVLNLKMHLNVSTKYL